MRTLLKVTLTTLGIFSISAVFGYVYLYVLPKGPEITGPEPLNKGKSSFVIDAYEDSGKKSIRVWTHKPEHWIDGDQILFVMHGASRNADDYLDTWLNVAEAKNILLIAPEFESQFSRIITNDYAEGNLFTFFGIRNPSEEWAFTVVENIFDYVIEQNNLSNTSYDIFGHSAGGQFVQRMVMLNPDARINTAIAANAGTYMFPDSGINFPYGLSRTTLSKSSIENSLERKLVILLGEMDNTADQGMLDQSELAMAQGAHRLARGTNFYRESARFANDNNFKFNWRMDTVSDVGHDYRKMSDYAAKYL